MMMMLKMWKMMVMFAVVTVYMLVSLIPGGQVRADCVQPLPLERNLTPSDGPGSSLFLVRDTNNTHYWINVEPIARLAGLHESMKFVRSGNDWILTLNYPPIVKQAWDGSTITWTILIYCQPLDAAGVPGGPTGRVGLTVYSRYLKIKKVYEMLPVIYEQNILRVREDVSANEAVARTHTMFKYRDFSGGDSIVKFYSTGHYNGTLPDGSQVFTLSRNGSVYLHGQLDFDKGHKFFGLAVTGHDYRGANATKFLEIHVTNVNDNPPMFLNTGCAGSCSTNHYSARIGAFYVGPVTGFTYGPIQAVDVDGESIEYSLVTGTPDDYTKYVEIDNSMGSLAVTKPLNSIGASPDYISITVQARSNGNLPSHRILKIANETQTFIQLWIIRYGTQAATGGADGQQVKGYLCLLGALLTIDFTASL